MRWSQQSPLWLNRELGGLDTWDEQAIVERAGRLAARAVEIWSRPVLPEGAPVADRSKPESGHSIEDHPYLLRSAQRALFEQFRNAVLALDDAVTETFLRHYVAYRAESNFVDVVPQARGLRLTLNMPFEALHDERGLAVDVTGKRKWGNGDVEVRLDEPADLNHVMGLVRQAYEYQVGE